MILIHIQNVLVTLGWESKKLVYFSWLITKTFSVWMLRYNHLKILLYPLSFAQKMMNLAIYFSNGGRSHHRSHRPSFASKEISAFRIPQQRSWIFIHVSKNSDILFLNFNKESDQEIIGMLPNEFKSLKSEKNHANMPHKNACGSCSRWNFDIL